MFLNQLFYIQNINSYQNLDLLSFFLFIFFIINTFNDNNHIIYFPWFSYFGLINCFYCFIWLSKFRAASLNELRDCVLRIICVWLSLLSVCNFYAFFWKARFCFFCVFYVSLSMLYFEFWCHLNRLHNIYMNHCLSKCHLRFCSHFKFCSEAAVSGCCSK